MGAGPLQGASRCCLYEWICENELSTRYTTGGEDLKGLVNYGGRVERFSDELTELMLLPDRAHHSPLLRESFLLLPTVILNQWALSLQRK